MISLAHESNKRIFDDWIMTSSKCIIVKYVFLLLLLVTHWASNSPQNCFIPLHRTRGKGSACSTYSRDWMAYILYSLDLEFLLYNSWYQGSEWRSGSVGASLTICNSWRIWRKIWDLFCILFEVCSEWIPTRVGQATRRTLGFALGRSWGVTGGIRV